MCGMYDEGMLIEDIRELKAKLSESEAKLAKAVEALERQAEAWSNALELNIIAPQHRTAASILRDEASAAIADLKGESHE